MDIFIKYALAVVAYKNKLSDISLQYTNLEKLVDAEIIDSLDYCFLATNNNPKYDDKAKYKFINHNLITNFTNVKPGVHVLVSSKDLNQLKSFNFKTYVWNRSINKFEFCLFNSRSYLSSRDLRSYSVPTLEKKLYFLTQITPYKPAFQFYEDKIHHHRTIFLDLDMPNLILYIKEFATNWKKFTQDNFEATVYKDRKDFFPPEGNKINYDIKYVFGNYFSPELHGCELYKFQTLNFFGEILNSIAIKKNYNQTSNNLFQELNSNPTIYEISIENNKSNSIKILNINSFLLDNIRENNIFGFVGNFVHSLNFEYEIKKGSANIKKINDEYKIKFESLTRLLFRFFKTPTLEKVSKILITFNIKKYNEKHNDKFMKILNQTAENEGLSKEIRDGIEEYINNIKGFIYHKIKENTKIKNKEEEIDRQINLLYYNVISKIISRDDFLKMSLNVKRRFGYPSDISKFKNYFYENPNKISDFRNYASCCIFSYKKKDKKDETENESIKEC